MYYLMYTTLMNNTWKDIGSLFTSLVFSLFILLSIFLLHACENDLVARSTSYDFFLDLEMLFLHCIRALLHVSDLHTVKFNISQGFLSSIELRSYLFSLSELIQSPFLYEEKLELGLQDFLLVLFM